jgi:hypothetical protein
MDIRCRIEQRALPDGPWLRPLQPAVFSGD